MEVTKKNITLGDLIDDFNSLLVGELLARSGDIDEPANKALKRLKNTLAVADSYILSAKTLKNFWFLWRKHYIHVLFSFIFIKGCA